MKKQIFFYTCALLMGFKSLQAQIKPAVQSEVMTSQEEHLAKNSVDLFAMSQFNEAYPKAADPSWIKRKNGYVVNFSIGDIAYNVFLNKKGQMTDQIRYYHEKDLPVWVRKQVKGYGGCSTIGLVKEITTELGTAYLVNVANEASTKVLRVAGDEVDVFEEFKKD